jgi:hypothetical protein
MRAYGAPCKRDAQPHTHTHTHTHTYTHTHTCAREYGCTHGVSGKDVLGAAARVHARRGVLANGPHHVCEELAQGVSAYSIVCVCMCVCVCVCVCVCAWRSLARSTCIHTHIHTHTHTAARPSPLFLSAVTNSRHSCAVDQVRQCIEWGNKPQEQNSAERERVREREREHLAAVKQETRIFLEEKHHALGEDLACT